MQHRKRFLTGSVFIVAEITKMLLKEDLSFINVPVFKDKKLPYKHICNSDLGRSSFKKRNESMDSVQTFLDPTPPPLKFGLQNRISLLSRVLSIQFL